MRLRIAPTALMLLLLASSADARGRRRPANPAPSNITGAPARKPAPKPRLSRYARPVARIPSCQPNSDANRADRRPPTRARAPGSAIHVGFFDTRRPADTAAMVATAALFRRPGVDLHVFLSYHAEARRPRVTHTHSARGVRV